jgi:hypothetical protein
MIASVQLVCALPAVLALCTHPLLHAAMYSAEAELLHECHAQTYKPSHPQLQPAVQLCGDQLECQR